MKSKLFTVGVVGCHKDSSKGNGNFLGGCKEETFEYIGIEEECVAVLASSGLVLR